MRPPKAISFEIRVLANLIKRKNDDGASNDDEIGVTGMQGWVIAYLKGNEDREVFQRDLERDFNIRRATVTGVLQLMERGGLIVRESVDYDARLKKITLTPKAIVVHELNVQRFKDFENELCRGLTEEEVASFFSIAEKLKKNLE